MFYRLYILYADNRIDEVIKEMLMTGFSRFIHIEENSDMLVFQVFNQENDNLLIVELEQVLTNIYQDTSSTIQCFVSQIYADNQSIEESLAATLTFFKSTKKFLKGYQHQYVVTRSELVTKMYLLSHNPLLFDEYTTFNELKKEQVDLLQILFKLNNNVVATSNHTYMHRNTINYQLQKIMQITGCDIRYSEDLFLLKLYFLCTVYIGKNKDFDYTRFHKIKMEV